MTRKKAHTPQVAPTTHHEETAPKPKNRTPFLQTPKGKFLPYALTFIGLWIFCAVTYGDVFSRTVQESFVTSDAELMKHLTNQDYGQLYLFGRYLLLVFHQPWLGGLCLSLLLTAATFFLDYAFRIPQWLRGISALLPFGFLFTVAQQGVSLFYKNEPSLFVLQATGLFLLAAILALISRIFLNKKVSGAAASSPKSWRHWSWGTLVVALSFAGLEYYAHDVRQNTILTAKMQNSILNNEIADLIEEGLKAEQPTRSVAAYYTIGLLQTHQLLEHVFDISFHFPKEKMASNEGIGEYGIFTADCNFYAGLLNSSYRSAMDQIVMNGPRLYYLKRIALCAILNQEKALANKYLTLIGKVPFEKDFVDTYAPMVDHPELIQQNASFAQVLSLYPVEQRFEQNYRSPAFLGYNIGMMEGNNASLAPSMAACMYSKDLPNLALRAMQYKRIYGSLPLSVQEALSIHARKHPDLYQYFPELNEAQLRLPNPANTNVNNFYLSIQEHFQQKYHGAQDWRERMGKELKEGISEDLRKLIIRDWKGHYVYYYYCENINQAKEDKQESSGVN